MLLRTPRMIICATTPKFIVFRIKSFDNLRKMAKKVIFAQKIT